MGFRDYLLLMGGGTVAAWVAWVVALFAMDPTTSGIIGFLLFFVTLALALIGSFSILGTAFGVWRHPDELVSRQVGRSFRHAILFTGTILGTLQLFASDLFRWWTVGLLLLTITFIELAFLQERRPNHH